MSNNNDQPDWFVGILLGIITFIGGLAIHSFLKKDNQNQTTNYDCGCNK